jgi:hypothetical protein
MKKSVIFFCVINFLNILQFFDLNSGVYFSSMSSSMVLKPIDSHFKIGNVAGISGWSEQSIVRASGMNNSWISNNTTYGNSVGEIIPPAHLIYSNSLAIEVECDHFIHDSNARLTVLGAIAGETSVRGRGILCSPIALNGATLTNGGDILFSSATTFVAPGGYLNPRGYAYLLGGDVTIPNGTDLRFTSSGIFDGQGHSLVFEGNARMRLDPNVTVTFRNIKIENIKNFSDGSASICMSPSFRCKLALEGAKLNLADTFSFTCGNLYMQNDVVISGSSQFNYTSTNCAFIAKNSSLMLDIGTTFSYGPLCANRELIKMTDETSVLYLNGCTFKSTATGLILTKGTLVIGNKNYLYNQNYLGSPAISLSEAVVFGGNGSSALNIDILPGGSLDLKSGILDYKNAN